MSSFADLDDALDLDGDVHPKLLDVKRCLTKECGNFKQNLEEMEEEEATRARECVVNCLNKIIMQPAFETCQVKCQDKVDGDGTEMQECAATCVQEQFIELVPEDKREEFKRNL